MKKTFLFLFTLAAFYVTKAQFLTNDSLQGFDLAKTVLEGRQKNFEHGELKLYIDNAKKHFINNKYNLFQNIPQSNSVSKYGSNYTSNLPCFNEDFESSPVGTLSAIGTWSAQQSSLYGTLCSASVAPMSSNLNGVYVYATPVSDPILGSVSSSPFGGSKIAKINSPSMFMSRVKQTFPVTSSNWLFSYAYLGVLSQELHGCCDDPYLMFKFYDCLGNPIPSLSHTVIMGTPSCVATSTVNWSVSTVTIGGWPTNYTPNWQIYSKDLSTYIGSCVTMEASASGCYSSAHPGYMYFDADCSDGNAMIINANTYQSPASSYTSCVSQTTLSALPGFSNYQWQGPPTSGISGATSSVITTSVSGNYTLSTSSGTFATTQILNLTVTPTLNVSITGSNSICAGETTTLQVSVIGASSYSWNTSSALPTITVTPSTTTIYSVAAINSLGCLSSDSKTLTVSPNPTLSISSTPTSICAGETTTLQVSVVGASSYSWNTSSTFPTITISPSSTTVYSVAATNAFGCLASDSKTVVVLPSPTLSISSTPTSICQGQNINLNVTPSTAYSYTWSNGALGSSAIVSPTVSSNYTITGTNSFGCVRALSVPVTVFPHPQLSVYLSTNTICLGQSASISATGFSGNTYSWSTGSTSSSITISPSITSVYNVTATTNFNCTATLSLSITVYPLPQIQLIGSSNEICVGETVNFGVLGSNIDSFFWNTGANTSSITVSPTLNSVYSVTVSSAAGCTSEQTISIHVNPLPQIQIIASSASICSGESATLAVNNPSIASYLWSGNQINSSVIVSPSITTQYSVTVTDVKGCMANSSFQLKVFSCADTLTNVGLNETHFDNQKLIIFPNPSDGSFEIRGYKTEKGILISELGQIISEFYLNDKNNYTFKISNLAKGIYFVKGDGSSVKIVVR